MHWTIGQCPELDHLDPVERANALQLVPWDFYPTVILKSFICGIFAGGVAILIFEAMAPVVDLLCSGALAIVAMVNWYLHDLKKVRMALRKEVVKAFKGQRPPFCLSCGYDFRNLTSDACPECGHRISDVPGSGWISDNR